MINLTLTELREGIMSDSFQREIPKTRINLKLELHTGGRVKKQNYP